MGIDIGWLILRLGVGLILAAHGAQKAFGWWGGPGLEGWTAATAKMGWHPARPWAMLAIAAELGGGLALAAGLLTPAAAAVVLAQALVIMGRAHLRNGFWNSAGGIEFPLLLAVGAAAIVFAGPGALSLDRAMGLSFGTAVRVTTLIVGLVGATAATWWPADLPAGVHGPHPGVPGR